MYNLQNFMQQYQNPSQQARPGIGQFQGYQQQQPGGYQPAQQMYQGTPAQIPNPQMPQGGPQGWMGQPWAHNMQAGGPNLQSYFPQQRMGLAHLMNLPGMRNAY